MLKIKPKITELNTVGACNFSSHRLLLDKGCLRLVPRLRSYFGEYFMLFGFAFIGAIILYFYAIGQMALKQLAIILSILFAVAMLLKWLFKRSYAHIIFDKQNDKIYNAHTIKSISFSSIKSVEVRRKKEWNINDEKSGYTVYGAVLKDNNGHCYSVVWNTAYLDIQAIAMDIANFIGVELNMLVDE